MGTAGDGIDTHGDVATWVRLCNGEKTSRNEFVLDEMWIALDFEEDLGLGDVLRDDGGPCFETDVRVHFRAGAERLIKGDEEGALVFRWRTAEVKEGERGVERDGLQLTRSVKG